MQKCNLLLLKLLFLCCWSWSYYIVVEVVGIEDVVKVVVEEVVVMEVYFLKVVAVEDVVVEVYDVKAVV